MLVLHVYLYKKNMGACKFFLVAHLAESRTQKPKCIGSNHGVDNRLVDLAMEKNSNRVADL